MAVQKLIGRFPAKNDHLNTSRVQFSDVHSTYLDIRGLSIFRLLNESYKRAIGLLKSHRRELDLLAEALLNYETLDAEDIR
jgi:ATP-dependent Zn protease